MLTRMGRDIVLLNRSYGAKGNGHNAVMIGNDKDGWTLYSKDGLTVNTKTAYASFNDFIKENLAAKHADQYNRAARVTTSETEDKKMQEHGDKVYDRKYSLWERFGKNGEITKQNCADLVGDIISNADSVIIDQPKVKIESDVYFGGKMIGKSVTNTGITSPNKQIENFTKTNNTEFFYLLP